VRPFELTRIVPSPVLDTPSVAGFPLAVFGSWLPLLLPPPQPAKASAASGKAASAEIMEGLRVMLAPLRSFDGPE
jgi:hypothetical protein